MLPAFGSQFIHMLGPGYSSLVLNAYDDDFVSMRDQSAPLQVSSDLSHVRAVTGGADGYFTHFGAAMQAFLDSQPAGASPAPLPAVAAGGRPVQTAWVLPSVESATTLAAEKTGILTAVISSTGPSPPVAFLVSSAKRLQGGRPDNVAAPARTAEEVPGLAQFVEPTGQSATQAGYVVVDFEGDSFGPHPQ